MEDKSTLGKFIQSKRKELGLSQKELAKALYVTESAVSKWERGISYPDITMISGICEALHISEHELCIASEDRQQREAELMAQSYKRFVRGYTFITGLCYLAAIIPSFIYNVVHGGVGWFFVLLTSLMLTFSVINVPVLMKKHRALAVLGSSTASLMLLYGAGCIYSHGDWFIMAALGTLLGEAVVFLPFVLRSELLERYVKNNKGLICMAADSLLILCCIAYGTLKYGGADSFASGMFAAFACLAIPWAFFLIIRYLRINGFFKAALCCAVVGIWTAVMTLLNDIWNGMKISEVIAFNSTGNGSLNVVVCLCFIGAGAVLGAIGAVYGSARKKKEGYKTDI